MIVSLFFNYSMFLKISVAKGIKYVQVVESCRSGDGSPRQILVANLGRPDKLKQNGWFNVIEKLAALLNYDLDDAKNNKKDISFMKELSRSCYGFLPYCKIWNKFKIDKIFNQCTKNNNIQFDFPAAVFSMVVNKLLSPSSKYYHYKHKDNFFSINDDI